MSRNRILSLQVVRGLAAASVVVAHAFRVPATEGFLVDGRLANIAAAGVDVFFVLSGVIIFLVAGGSPSAFMRRRFLRVMPLYYVATIPYIVVAILASGVIEPDRLATSYLFWGAWGDRISVPYIAVGWTLNFEMLFYLSAALVIWARHWALVLIAVYAAAWFGRVQWGWPVLQVIGNPIILEFLMGVAIAALWRRWQWNSRALAWTMVIAGVAALIALPSRDGALMWMPDVLNGKVAFERVVWWGIPAALIVAGALGIEARKSFLTYLGDASYSVYLGHSLLMSAFLRLPPMQADILALIIFTYGMTIGIALHEFVEKPLLAYLHRRRASPQLAPA